jgi:hypothetical protein
MCNEAIFLGCTTPEQDQRLIQEMDKVLRGEYMSDDTVQKRGRTKGDKSPADPEALAFSRCVRILEGVSRAAARRTVRHLGDRFASVWSGPENSDSDKGEAPARCNATPLSPGQAYARDE